MDTEVTTSHDQVISQLVTKLNQKDYDIYQNPGQEKNAGIQGCFPDIVMTEKGKRTVKFILEVETGESVSEQEASIQWKEYSDKINATFYIVIPSTALRRAKEYCVKYNVSARFATYIISDDGTVSFDFNVA